MFTPELFTFLRELRDNNDRDWFAANKDRYEEALREPALQFITDFAPHLEAISPHFSADARRVGGSLFRIHRDVRFSRDKSPYKTHTGIQFRHAAAESAHSPGFYLHLEPGSVWCAAGIWRPDREPLSRLRAAIAADPDGWRATITASPFADRYRLDGEALKRPPAGYDPDHPAIEDLKRKDFIAVTRLSEEDVIGPGFLDRYAETCRTAAPFVAFICRGIGMPF